MKKIRKILIKYMYSSYMVKLFGKSFAFKRAANIHTPLMFLVGYGLITEGYYNFCKEPQPILTISLLLFLLSCYISIIYFNRNKVDFEELDREQKFFRGYQHLRMPGIPGLTVKQYDEWIEIVNEFEKNKDEFKNVIPFLINIITLILFITIII